MADMDGSSPSPAKTRLTIAYYVTGHGLGHATRVVEVCRQLLLRGHAVHVVTAAPHHVFQRELAAQAASAGGALELRNAVLDVGAKQRDAITVDRRGSLEQYARHSVLPRQKHLAFESAWLHGIKADVVVTDIVPLACAAAREAGVPCAAITNFCWDFIYSEYLTEAGAQHRAIVWQIAEDYAKADVCLRLPGFTPMPAFRDVQDLPLVVRRAKLSRAEVRASYGIDEAAGERLLLFNFGGQASEWRLQESFLPPGWRCVVCTALAIQDELPSRFTRADPDAYIPDLMLGADAIIGKLGYGTVSEALAHSTPFVFVRRDYFNEEPFLRQLLEMHGFAVEIARTDFFNGNWHAHLARALQLQPEYPGAVNGGEVAVAKIEELAAGNLLSNPRLGAIKLQDAVVYGYKMLRAGPSLNVPQWYAQGLSPGSTDNAGHPASPRPRRGSIPAAAPNGADVPVTSLDLPCTDTAVEDAAATVPQDTAKFVALLDKLRTLRAESAHDAPAPAPADGVAGKELSAAASLFTWSDAPEMESTAANVLYVGRAPGRLDVMGGIADYSGSTVLQMPVSQACHVAVQRQQADGQPHWQHEISRRTAAAKRMRSDAPASIRIVSLNGDATNRSSVFDMPMSALLYEDDGTPRSYESAQQLLTSDPTRSWAAYVAGALLILRQEKGAFGAKDGFGFGDECKWGLSLLIDGRVPDGKGVSSSASIEVATMQAVGGAVGVELEPRELAILCQKVENLIVGAPCGLMDQMASSVGQASQLMAMDCRPAEVRGTVPIPPHMKFWGIDSGIRHSVGGADYGSVRVGAFIGRRMMAVQDVQDNADGMSSSAAAALLPVESDQRYIAAVPVHTFTAKYESRLPETISGADFLRDFGGHGDAVTTVDPDKTYAVRTPTAHPVFENFRVTTFEQLLAAPDSDAQLAALGELMYQSHTSYSLCGLGSSGTDRLVRLVQESNVDGKGPLFGAKITGGGSGGTVCVLGRDSAEGEAAIKAVVAKYKEATGHAPVVFSGSSQGAGRFGVLKLQA